MLRMNVRSAEIARQSKKRYNKGAPAGAFNICVSISPRSITRDFYGGALCRNY